MSRRWSIRRRSYTTAGVLVGIALLAIGSPAGAANPQTPKTLGNPENPENAAWEAIGPNGGNVTALAVASGDAGAGAVYAGTDFGGLWKSTNGGATWVAAGGGISDAAITAIAVDPVHAGVVYVGTAASGVWKSLDAGASWAAANQGLLLVGPVAALAVDPAASDVVWVSISGGFAGNGGVFASADGANSWTAKTPRVSGVEPEVEAIVFAGSSLYAVTTRVPVPSVPTVPGAAGAGAYILKSGDGGQTWLPLVIQGLTSEVTSLTFDPTAPRTLYAGSPQGVWKSRNAGANWLAASPMVNPDVVAVATDPGRSGTVYAATQSHYDASLGVNGVRSGGVFRSLDGGSTWQRAGRGMPLASTQLGTNTLCLAVDPAHTGILFAGNQQTGVWKTTNFAADWTLAVEGLRALPIVRVAVDPKRPGTIYAGGGPGTGLYGTKDGGVSWQELLGDTGVSLITLDPVRTLTVYVGADSRLLRSRDGGGTWTPLGAFGPLAIDPTHRATLYAGTANTGVFKSLDFGGTWSPPANTHVFPCFQPLAIAVDPRVPSNVYVGGANPDAGCQDRGVLFDQSRDGGLHWHQLGQGVGTVLSLVIDPATSTLYAAAAGGVAKSSDGGATWQVTGLSGSDHSIQVVLLDPLDLGAIYAGDFSGGIFWSSDAGVTWSRLADPLAQRSVADLALTPSSATLVYAATTGGLFRVTRQP